ncbi:MAG TPA: site-specific integrase, partial [Rhodanobacter sp.]|nr:site-specific integrase [Rhodanobacter sp.]
REVMRLLRKVEQAIKDGSFVYAQFFPNSPRAARFASGSGAPGLPPAIHGALGTPPGVPMPATMTSSNGTALAAAPVFATFAETWYAEMTPQWRGRYRENVRAVLDRDLLPRFGTQPLARIGKAEVLALRAELAQRPGKQGTLGPARINKILGVLRQILNEAADRFGLVPAFRGIKPLKLPRSEVQPFTLEEVQRILAMVRPDYRHYLTVRFFTGLRTGEINALMWEHIDFTRSQILVRQTLVDGEATPGGKTLGSVRDVPMLPMVRQALEAQFQQRRPDVSWVFATREGGPVDGHNFNNRIWLPLLRYLSLKPRRPYQTRHTAATLMLAAGENPEWIARVLGHANTEMLFKVYSRFVPNLTRRDGLALAGLLEQRPLSVIPVKEDVMTPPS